MRFDSQAFKASVKPMTADESRANMAELAAKSEQDGRFVSVEREFDDVVAEVAERIQAQSEPRHLCA